VKPTRARALLLAVWSILAFGLLGVRPSACQPARIAAAETSPAARTVYLGHGLSDVALIQVGAAVAAAEPSAVLLLDSECLAPYSTAFLTAYRPERVVPVGSFPDGVDELEERLGIKLDSPVALSGDRPTALWRRLFSAASAVVVCPAEPRGQLLQAACLAGTLRAPLFVLETGPGETALLRELIATWKTRDVYLVGAAKKLAAKMPEYRCIALADARAAARLHVDKLAAAGTIRTAVVANPHDALDNPAALSVLGPWLAVQKKAPLLLTAADGKDAGAVVEAACKRVPLRHVESLILVADLKAIPMEQRANPIPADKDPQIDMEPLTPAGREPFSYAVGRLFHDDRAAVPLLLARQRLLPELHRPPRALVASNPGNGLPLLETFSRNTVRELRNAGYETTALFGNDVACAAVRKLMAEHDVFLWEGHHATLIREFGMPEWDEPLRPSLVFLQSCLALKDYKAHPLLSRGAVGVIGSSTRTYSASGGACSLAFFDALLYDGQSVGASLRQAKNFLIAYSLLKEKRLGKDAKRTGANLRAAWAFTLWGDPTLELPRPERPADAMPPVAHTVHADTIVLEVPDAQHEKVQSGKYLAQMPANARLAGLLRKDKEPDGQPLVPFAFAEVRLPRAKPGLTPQLSSRIPASHWVFNWDARRGVGYLLVEPRSKDETEMRFHVKWEPAQSGAAGTVGAGE
jgi:hypothetical protein